MAERALDIYLNDHLAGAVMGCEIADELAEEQAGSHFGDAMAELAVLVNEDRATLEALMDRLGTTSNPVKQGAAWLAEKAGRVKLKGLTSGDRDLGTFLALETLGLGVEGKICLWESLRAIANGHEGLAAADLEELVARGERQRATIEAERIGIGARVLRDGSDPEP